MEPGSVRAKTAQPPTPTRSPTATSGCTPTEWHLLEVLLRNPGKLLSHRQLLNEVWGPGYDNAGGNLRLYMAQLRRKLEPDPARPRWLITEPGMGYRYQPPDQTEPERRSRPGAVQAVWPAIQSRRPGLAGFRLSVSH